MTDINEGLNTDPEFVFLDVDKQILIINPVSGRMIGKSYAVYITGHVFLNETIQGPMTAHNPYGEVSVPIPFDQLVNSAPKLEYKPYKLIIPAGVTETYRVGIPFD